MANMHTNSFIHSICLNEENSLLHLLDQISPEIENETNLLEHSKYYNDVDFKSVLHNASSSKISMISLNCRSINAKFDKLKIFLDDVNKGHPIAAICIQESWGHEEMELIWVGDLNLLKARSNFVYICGDYNIDILKMSSNHAYNTF